MSVDINQDLRDISSKIGVYQTYKEFRTGYDDLKKRAGNSFEEDKKYVAKLLNQFDRNSKDKKDNTCQPFLESLLKQLKQLKGSGLGTETFVKRIFLDTLKDVKKDLIEFLLDLFKKELNCGINQTYQFNTTFHIPVSMVDLFGMLENAPDSKFGKLFYEQKNVNYAQHLSNPTSLPFSMNRELYKRTQNLNQTFSSVEGSNYLGTSVQNLFDISYVESYVDPNLGPQIGSFFKIELKPRQSVTSPDQFLSDYMSTIDVLEFKSFFTYLANYVTGAISFGQNEGKLKLTAVQKTLALNKRISCLCADKTQEISVAGTSKVSEVDNVDDSFFELTDVELRIIEQNISNIKLGVVEFEDCDNIKVPLDAEALLTALDDLQFNEDTDDLNEFQNALNIINPAVNNTFTAALNEGFLKQFLNALVGSILSPKVILPFMIMLYATNQQVPPQVKNIEDFTKQYRTFYITFVSKLLSKFTQKVLKEIKKQIIRLVTLLNSDILNEKKKKIQDMILSIVTLIATPVNLVQDLRECKAGIDEILALLNAGVKARVDKLADKGAPIPLPLLLASEVLDGYSPTRAFLNTVENLEALGIPTGPMPDGSPNKFVASIKGIFDGNSQEVAQNGKVAIGVGALTVTPAGITIPKSAYGKFI